jgi:hypothetical protein
MAGKVDVEDSAGRDIGELRGTGKNLDYYDEYGRHRGRARVSGGRAEFYDEFGNYRGKGEFRPSAESEFMAWGGLGLAIVAIAFILTVAIFFVPWWLIYRALPSPPGLRRALLAYALTIFTILTWGIILLVYFKLVLPRTAGDGHSRAWEAFAITQPATWLYGIPSLIWWWKTDDPAKKSRIAFGTFAVFWGVLLIVYFIATSI